MRLQPSGTVTLVFTDIEGSTELLEELGRDRYLVALTEHRQRIREAFAHFDGYEVDYEGDSFLYAFQSAMAAVAAVGEAMKALRDGPIRVRVGVHTGEPVLDPPKYVGMDVHRAARIMACAHGGQVVVSHATRELLEDPGALRDLGEHRLKDLSAPVRLYQLGEDEFPPLRSLYRTNLPVPATPFLGREQELAEIDSLLKREGVRLLTLTGPGGTGKTRLALQAAAASADRYPDGVWWIPLASLRDADLLLPTVVQALEVPEQPGRDVSQTLAERLLGMRGLLLLDNLEHLLPAAATAMTLLRDIGGPQVLVTSRERLQLAGEQVYPVPALADSDAAALFTARASQLDPAFTPGRAVATLCTRLDNLPLAIELAAARTSLFSAEQLLARLGERLDLLRAGRDSDPRQETLRATIDWSYQLLDDEEQRVYRAMSVFLGGCTLEPALEICDTEADTLQSLLDKSLLRRRESGPDPRYWMLETIRQHAEERLAELGQADVMADRHATWCLTLASEADRINSDSPDRGLERLTADSSNLLKAFEWALAHDDSRCLRLGVGVARLCMSQGFNERGWLAGHRALAFQGAADEVGRACLMAYVASFGVFQGEFREARLLAEAALEPLRAAGLNRGVAWDLQSLGEALIAEGDVAGGLAAFDEGVESARRAATSWPLGQLLGSRANVALHTGDLAAARRLLEEATLVQPQHPALPGTLAEVALAQNNLDEARECLERAIELSGENLLWLTMNLFCQAAVEEAANAHERAVTLMGAAERMADESGVSHQGFGPITHRYIRAVQALSHSEEWHPAWEAGREMSKAETIAYARRGASPNAG